jgi:energy-coupling factor transport system permease protein
MQSAPDVHESEGSAFTQLDPRAKISMTAIALICIAAAQTWTVIFLWLLFYCFLLRLFRVPLRKTGQALRAVRWLLLLTLAYQLANAGYRLSQGIGGEVFLQGLLITLRLGLLILFASLLPSLTPEMELSGAMERILSPLARLKIPVGDVSMMMALVFRFVPLIAEEYERIRKAQISRGARLDEGGPVRRIIALFPVLIPLFVQAFRRAEVLAEALESRGWVPGTKRNSRRSMIWKKNDSRATIYFICAAVLISLGGYL